jgi:hypothetical protein
MIGVDPCRTGCVHRGDHERVVPVPPGGLAATDWMPVLEDVDDGIPRHLVAAVKPHFVTETYIVTRKWFEAIVDWSDLAPTIDAFADGDNAQLPRFWDPSTL